MTLNDKHFRILRFLVSGGLAAIVEATSFLLLNNLNRSIVLANSVSFVCALVVSFGMNKLWVFSSKGNVSRQFTLYFTLAAVNLAMSNLIIWLMVNEARATPLIAKILTMMIIAVWNYAFFSKLIFKERHIDV
jgi:putative flippase GtrA